jgi:hypothetical protein
MKKLSLLLLYVVFAGFVLTGCRKNDEKKNYLQVGGTTYDLVLGEIEYYGTATGGYDMGLNLCTAGITFDNAGTETGAGTTIFFEVTSSVNDGISTGTYEYSSESGELAFYNTGYCLDWTTGSPNVWGYFDSSKGGYLKVTRSGSTYEVTFKGVDEDGNTVKGNLRGIFTLYNFSSTKSGGSHK